MFLGIGSLQPQNGSVFYAVSVQHTIVPLFVKQDSNVAKSAHVFKT